MATGRILQFDQARGYGFCTADDGGEDVFLHASVFEGDLDDLVPGAKMEFKIMAGDRGRKAFAAHLIDDDLENDPATPPRPVPAPRPGPTSLPPSPSRLAPSPPSAQTSSALASHAPGKDQVPDDEQMCDVMSSAEFRQELTELLVSNVPSLTGQQIHEVRQCLLDSAKKHGWVDM